jgi:predicted phosphoribosyltransferase
MFFSVGQVYEDFHHLSDREVIELLENFNNVNKHN